MYMKNAKKTDVHIRISINNKRKLQENAKRQKLSLSDYILRNTVNVKEDEINLDMLSAYTKIAVPSMKLLHWQRKIQMANWKRLS